MASNYGITKYNPRPEALHFIRLAPLTCIPKRNRKSTLGLINELYTAGAMSVEVSQIVNDGMNRILELYVRVFPYKKNNDTGARAVLGTLLSMKPFSVEEIRTNVFRVNWKRK